MLSSLRLGAAALTYASGIIALTSCGARSLASEDSDLDDGGSVMGSASSGTGGSGGTSGCGAPGSAGAAGLPGASGGTPADASAPTCAPLAGSQLCSQNPTGPVQPGSLDGFMAAIVGRWVLCGQQSLFGVNRGDVGLEITSDRHWYKLFPAVGGGAIRGAGFDEEGTWTALTNGATSYQLNFDTFGGGGAISTPHLASMPRAIRLDNIGTNIATYVDDPNVTIGTVRCKSAF